MQLTVQAQHLQIGDKVPGRYGVRIVTHGPHRDSKIAAGKVYLGLDGYLVTWGARTEITVERAERVAS